MFIGTSKMKSGIRRGRYPSVPVDLDIENLAKRLNRDLTVTPEASLPAPNTSSHEPDENPSSQSGNDWHAKYSDLYFGHREFGRVVGKEICRVSALPFSDIVLTSDGDEMLTPNAIAMIKRLSTKFVDSRNIHVHDGPFGCIFPLPKGIQVPTMAGDRPLPYFYSSGAPGLKGRLIHTIRTSAQGRMVKFVIVGGECVLPEELREQVLYLVPGDEDWCIDVTTRFLPLDWKPSHKVRSGTGKNLFMFAGYFSTTSQERSFEEDRRRARGGLIVSTVLEVHDGVVESMALDEKLYNPKLIETVHEVAGKRVLVYRPLKEAQNHYRIVHKVLKRVERYDQLLQKIGGSWPKKIAGLESCLSVTMTELIVAGIYDPDVRKRFPCLYCFLERLPECVRERSELSVERESNDVALAYVAANEKDHKNTGHVVEEKDCVPVAFVMNLFYKYSPITRSYYAINRPVDKPVVISSDGEVIHFIETDVPVPVLSTPFGMAACARLQSNN